MTAVGWAYWEFGIANPAYYGVMFGGAIPDFTPDETSRSIMRASLTDMMQAIQHYIDQGQLPDVDAVVVTQSLWITLHGLVSLKLSGHFAAESQAQTLLRFSLDAWLAGLLGPATT
jgi:hypothetical protein